MHGDTIKRWIVLFIVVTGCFTAFAEPSLGFRPQIGARPPIRILFLGNSLTFMPDWNHPTVPSFVKSLLDSKQIDNDIDLVLRGGHTLENHWDEKEFQRKLATKHYDYVFIQPYSIEALELPECFKKFGPHGNDGPEGREKFLEYAQKMIDLVRLNGALPIIIEPWTYDEKHPWIHDVNFECRNFRGTLETWYGGSIDELQRRLDRGFQDLKDLTGVEILDIGGIWEKLRMSKKPTIALAKFYQPDHYHPTYLGSLLSAFVITKRLTHISADQFDFCPSQIQPEEEDALEKMAVQYQSGSLP